MGGIVGQQRKAEKLLMSLDKEGGLPLALHDVGGDEDDVQNYDDAKDTMKTQGVTIFYISCQR